MDDHERHKYVDRIIELESRLRVMNKRLHDRDLEIVGLNHEIMVLREAMVCDPCEDLDA